MSQDGYKLMRGCDVAAILGMHPKAGVNDVYNEKHGIADSKVEDVCGINDHMVGGMLQFYRELNDKVSVVEPNPYPAVFGKKASNAHATIVNFETNKMVGIVKCCAARRSPDERWGEPDTEDVPNGVYIEAAWDMALYDVPWCNIIAHLNGEFVVYRIKRRADVEQQLLEKAKSFYVNHIHKQVPPSIDETDACFGRLAELKALDGEIPGWPEMDLAVEKLRQCQATIKELKGREKELKATCIDLLGSQAKRVKGEDYTAFWNVPTPQVKTDWQKVALELNAPEEIVAKHTYESTIKPSFKLSAGKKKEESAK